MKSHSVKGVRDTPVRFRHLTPGDRLDPAGCSSVQSKRCHCNRIGEQTRGQKPFVRRNSATVTTACGLRGLSTSAAYGRAMMLFSRTAVVPAINGC